jgi:ribonuclease E
MGLIVRTAGVGQEAPSCSGISTTCTQLWQAIEEAAKARKAPFLIYQESKLIIRALRDYLRADIGEILIDSRNLYNEAREFMQQVMPQSLRKLKLYDEAVPLFTRLPDREPDRERLRAPGALPSGGSMVIDHTEALTAVDINSARATKGATSRKPRSTPTWRRPTRSPGRCAARSGWSDRDRLHRHPRAPAISAGGGPPARCAQAWTGRAFRSHGSRAFGLLEMSRQRLRPRWASPPTGVPALRWPRHHPFGVEAIARALDPARWCWSKKRR